MENIKRVVKEVCKSKKRINLPNGTELIPLAEAKKILNLSSSFLWSIVRKNKITHYKIGKLIFFEEIDLIEFVKNSKVNANELAK